MDGHDGQYPPPIPPLAGYYTSGPAPIYPPESFPPTLHQLQTLSMDNLGAYAEFNDNQTMLPPEQGSQRQRRRQPAGPDHVKHRRTRSGCYTCRQRRVKCDETHPICDRCRKGKRECTYPDNRSSSSSKSSRSNLKSKGSLPDSGSSPSGDEDDADEKLLLSSIPDDEDYDDEEDADQDESEPQSGTSDVSLRKPLGVSSARQSKPILPPTESSPVNQRAVGRPQALRAASKHASKPSISQSGQWSKLPKDVKAYLKYHRDSLSYHHYAFKYDAGNFLKTTFLEIAMNDDSSALLYAIVAFAAYHHTLTRDDDKISAFLAYYNKSITLLQQSLMKKRHSVATLLTILQLATIEEFLGDWVNLIGHQKAAHQILTELFTPQTIMQDETRRKIIAWYIRFDLFAGIMSGGETALGREWFASCADFYDRQALDRPNDLGAMFEKYFSASRLLATDIALLFAAKTKNVITDDQFASDTTSLTRRIAEFKSRVETAFTDTSYFVKTFPKAPPPSEEDITDFRDPNFLYGGELFTLNYVLIDFWSIDLMFKYQLTIAQQQEPPPELTQNALKQCKLFEAIQYCDQGAPGAVMGCQASLGIASLFLPKDKKHTDWCRRKYALIEQQGYIYPTTMRKRMTDLWGVDVTHWWLPNDEGYPKVIRAIKDFIEYRARLPANNVDVDVRDMSGIFRAMNMSDHSSIPDDLQGTGTDSDTFEIPLHPSLQWESSPEQLQDSQDQQQW